MKTNNSTNNITAGTLIAAGGFTIWGCLPLYWKLFQDVSPVEILAHRMLWSFFFLLVVLLITKGLSWVYPMVQRPKLLLPFAAGAALLCVNWFTFIYAITSDRILEASIGYYINPLFNVLLGMLFFRERLNLLQWLAIISAAAGVCYFTLQYGKVPWAALLLTLSFGLYGLLKKKVSFGAIESLFLEMMFLLPVTGVILWRSGTGGTGAFVEASTLFKLLFMTTGVATVVPVALFGAGAKKIPMIRLAFLQYLSPSLMLIIGTFIYREPFTHVQMVCFASIWFALALYSVSHIRKKRMQ